MALLNYTTTVSASRTVGEIQEKLAKAGAHQILHEYGEGCVTALSFKIKTRFGDMAFRLPANIEAVKQVLRKQFPRSKAVWDKAPNVGWRILKVWVDAQLALIETGMVSVEEVFLPYLQNKQGITLFEALEKQRFSGFALEDRK
jgi:hypothetical protein